MMPMKAAVAILTAALPNESPALISLLVEFEGCRTAAYQDSAGHCTIGVGHRLPDGGQCGPLRWSATQIAEALEADIEAARTRYPAYILSKHSESALTSLAFNVGDLHGSALIALIDGGADLQRVAQEWVTWDHVTLSGGDKEVSRGLLLRRLREAAVYVEGFDRD